MFIRSLALIFVSATLLSGCASIDRGTMAAKAKVRMLGMSQKEIQTCMGEPKNKVQGNGEEIWTYYSSSGRAPRAENFFRPTGISLPSNSYEKNYCLINVTMKKNVVEAIEYLGPTSSDFFNKDDQCGYAVARCIKP